MKRVLLILLLPIPLLTIAQSDLVSNRFVQENQKKMDSVKSQLRSDFPNFRSTKPVTRKQIRADKKVIEFLNKFYNNDASIDEIRNWLKPFFKYKWGFQVFELGHSKKYDTRVKSEGNLDVHISFATFNDQIVYKRIYFSTDTETLFDPNEPTIFLPPDVNYLDSFLISTIHFPISFCIRCHWIDCDTTYTNKLVAFKSTGFKFFPDTSYINYMTWFDNDVYKIDYAIRDICEIVKRNDTTLLEQLLYSPNHILAIYAMEALAYMKSIDSYSPSSVTSEQMNRIINSDINIRWQTSDVVHSGVPYRHLRISNGKIISKFKAQLLHK